MELMFNLPAFYACLALEMTGITHFTWVLAHTAAELGGMRKQEEARKERQLSMVNNNMKQGRHNIAYAQEA
jgi:hypothetical protein